MNPRPDSDNLTPMMQQFFEVKRLHPDALVFFRMGDFFELFHEDAVLASKELGITLTRRGKGPNDSAPMCGVPVHSHQGYLARLVEAGHRVAICDQVEDPRKAKGLVKREVIRVVTPGTFADAEADAASQRHLLACLTRQGDALGLAVAELSTGRLELSQANADTGAWLADEFGRVQPRELLMAEGSDAPELGPGASCPSITRRPAWWFESGSAAERVERHLGAPLKSFDLDARPLAVAAAGALLAYLEETQKSSLAHLKDLRVLLSDDAVHIDATTARNLELTRNLSDGSSRHTLLDSVDRCATPMGSRLLRDWLLRPSRRLEDTESRHAAVDELTAATRVRSGLRELLGEVRDMERLLARVTLGTANARDLLALTNSLARVPELRDQLASCASPLLEQLRQALDPLEELTGELERALAPQPPTGLREGGLIRSGYHAERDQLHELAHAGKSSLAALESQEREATGINSLKVRYNKVFGYFIEVSKANLGLVPERYERRQTLANAERYVTPELKEWESKVLSAEERLLELEYELFVELRSRAAGEAERIGRTARAVAMLDVLSGWAELALERAWTRPRMRQDWGVKILEGRHPVVEDALGRDRFVPNDCYFEPGARAIQLVTGPNMGGKSTYLRQVALISLLAHAGSFVPAREAEIGRLDRIFARVGASDDLARGASTFMVEMVETANILRAHSRHSLILLDEVGRGTSTFDGLSLAWSIVEYLHDSPEGAPMVLFATHYHELTDLAELLSGVHNLRVAVREWEDEIVFLRRIEDGAADRSYGIHVARLAGLPSSVLGRARQVLANLESAELDLVGSSRLARRPSETQQLSLFGAAEHPLLGELRELDVDGLTPLDALNLLARMRKRLRGQDGG